MLLLALLFSAFQIMFCGDAAQADGVSDPTQVLTPAPLPLQPVGTPFVDPIFGTTLRRVSNTSNNGDYETQTYSQLQAFSSDNAFLLLEGSDGFIIRRVSDLGKVSGINSSGWNAPRWYPAQPHTIVHFDTNANTVVRVKFTNVDTGITSTAYTFPPEYEYVRVNQSWDELSHDGRWMAGMLTRNDGESVIFALDLQNGVLGAELTISDLYAGPCEPDPEWGEVEPDWIGVSPLGRYLVVQWTRDGTTRCSGLESLDLQTGEFVGRSYDGHQHGDLGVDVDGDTEYFMTFESAGPYPDNDRPAIGVRELPGTATVSQPSFLQSLDWGQPGHISCQGPNGVGLVTCDWWNANGWTPFESELYLQYTDGSVLRLVHHRSSSCGYWVQPRASISRDGRFVVFASDWGQGTGTNSCDEWDAWLGAGDPYIIDLEGVAPDNTVSGCVNLGGSPLEDVKVLLKRWGELIQSTRTDVEGCYDFDNVIPGTKYKVIVKGPRVDSPNSGISGCADLKGLPLANKKVILKQKGELKQATTTDANGCYEFGSVVSGKRFKVIIIVQKVE